ncbi:hypothetical protein TALC_00935 [Thermoplasmatales archaeon BRNA1]|nr:hypothetical protein TALC_00935 [Thermoplasmatales archaeon BRNA1]
MDDSVVRMKTKVAMDGLYSIITLLMAASMIVYALAEFYYRMDDYGVLRCLLYFTLPAVCGALIILDRHRSIFFAVGMFAISLGFSRFMRYYHWVDDGPVYQFYAGLVLCFLALNLMYSGYRYMSRNSRTITYILIGSVFFALTITAELIFYLRMSAGTLDFLEKQGNLIANLVMYILYIGLVWSEPVRNSTDLARMERTLSAHRMTEGGGPDISVLPENAKKFADFVSGEYRGDEPVAGPVAGRTVVQMHDGLSVIYCSLERWKDSRVFMMVAPRGSGSLIDPDVFAIRETVLTEERLAIVFADGRTGSFRIRDRDEDDGPVRLLEAAR